MSVTAASRAWSSASSNATYQADGSVGLAEEEQVAELVYGDCDPGLLGEGGVGASSAGRDEVGRGGGSHGGERRRRGSRRGKEE
eukprot:754178-Hanusia_phi.AAC.9